MGRQLLIALAALVDGAVAAIYVGSLGLAVVLLAGGWAMAQHETEARA